MKKSTNEFMENLMGEATGPMKLMRMERTDYFREMLKPLKFDKEKPVVDELLDEAGITNEEFAEQALNSPTLWQPDEIELFEAILAGEPVDRSFLSGLYEEVVTGKRTAKTVRESAEPPVEEETADGEEKDPEELAEEMAPLKRSEDSLEGPSVPSMNTRHIDTTGWWNK